MAQHLNNQMHQMNNLGMLTGLNFTILNNQQAHLGQAFTQPGQQGMYQIVHQVPGQHQVQLQNVQHQFQNQFHHMQPQQFNPQNIQILQQQNQQLTHQQIQSTQQQQPNHQQIQHHQPVQQQQQQIQSNTNSTPTNNAAKGNKSKQNKNNQNTNQHKEVVITKSGKKKRTIVTTNKDGVPAPKRATTAYINFTQYYRDQMKKSGRSVPKIGEFGKECAAKWNSMSEEEKKPFTDEAEKERERYRREMEIFKPSRDNNKPKRPGTAFMLFMGDFRKELAGKEPEGGVAALAKLGGERWRSMTDEQKKPYVEQQNQCKIVYEGKMEEYRKLTGQTTGKSNSTAKAILTSVKSEDSNASEHLNNSLSNSNISNNNVDQLNNHHDDSHHNSQSPGSTSPHTANNLAQQQSMIKMDQDPQSSLQSISTTISLQAQPFYTTSNSFMSGTFLDQQHEDASYSQTIDQQIHDGQTHEQNDQQAYIHANGQNYQAHYGWN